MWMDIAQQEMDQQARSDEEDTVYDRTNPFTKDSTERSSSELRVMLEDNDTRCGLGTWRPQYLQKFSNKTFFSIVFTLVGVVQGSFWTFYTANISTLEKRFSIDSTSSGVLLFANELAQLLTAVVFTYFGFRRHRAKILTLGIILSSLSCFFMASPHYIFGAGNMAKSLVKHDLSMKSEILPNPLPMMMEGGVSIKIFDETTEYSITRLPSPIPAEEVVRAAVSAQNANVTSSVAPQNSTTVFVNGTSDSNGTTEATTLSNSSTVGEIITTEPPAPPTTTSAQLTTKTEFETTTEKTFEEADDYTSPEILIPYLNDEMRHVWPLCTRDAEVLNEHSAEIAECQTKEQERKLTYTLIFISNFIAGLASMMFLLSGGPFAEDTTIMPNELPRIFGITLALRLIGPFFGYLFAWSILSEFINPRADVVQYDSRWLGAWWLGWTFLGVFMAGFAFIFSLFPNQTPREFLKKRSLTQETGSTMLLIPNVGAFYGGAELKAANPFPSITHIANVVQGYLRNKTYLLISTSTLIHVFVGVGYWTFLPKYLEFIFRLKAADAAMLTGVSSVPFQVAGLMLGGAFISRYLPRSGEISFWNVIVTILSISGLVMISFMGCSTNKIDLKFKNSIHHLTPEVADHPIIYSSSPSPNEPPSSSSVPSYSHCSADCDCKLGPILPICDTYTGTTFYSACHAGCEKLVNLTTFSQCSCLPFENITLTEGFCPEDNCHNGLIAFLVLTGTFQFLHSSGVVGRMLMSYKSIQADQRTAIIGLTLFFVSIVSVIPSPIVYGSLFESACLIRDDSCNDQEGNCLLYDSATLRFAYNLGTAAFMMIALVCDVLLWKAQKLQEIRIYDGELSQNPNNNFEPSSSHSNRSSSILT